MTTVKNMILGEPTRLARPDEIPEQLRQLDRTLTHLERKMTNIRRVEVPDSPQSGGATAYGTELDRLTKEYQIAYEKRHGSKMSYLDALKAVSAANPTLANAYANVDRDAHRRGVQDGTLESRTGSDSDAAADAEEATKRERHRRDSFDPKYRGRIESRPDANQAPLTRVPDQAQIDKASFEAGKEVAELVRQAVEMNPKLTQIEALAKVMFTLDRENPTLANDYRRGWSK